MFIQLAKRIFFIITFFGIIFLIIAFARGYRPSLKEKKLVSTGILTISSLPKSAQVFLNGELKGITDVNLTLPPGKYLVEVKKDGYLPWKKEITLKGELVINLFPTLFSINPSLSPKTNIGITRAIPVDDTGKALFFVDKDDLEKDGLYLFDINKSGLSFFPSLKPLIKKNQFPFIFNDGDFSSAEIRFSPDYKQAMLIWKENVFLIGTDEENSQPFDISNSYQTLLSAWEDEKKQQEIKLLTAFGKDFVKVATDSFKIVAFSPDETKILYQAKKNVSLPLFLKTPLLVTNQTKEDRQLKINQIYVYDKKEDRNYSINNLSSLIDNNYNDRVFWYSDSRHLVFVKDKKITITDYDGENEQTVYSGPFEKEFLMVGGDGQLIILANLNPEANSYPDLYSVSLK